MVKNDNNDNDDSIEITSEEQPEMEESELVDIEEKSNDKLKKMREKLAHCEEEKRKIQDAAQLAKADFLNARKRLDEERVKDKARYQKQHILELLPLCDSFQMAMADNETWEKADKSWRAGVEGIHTQLQQILGSHGVESIDPIGDKFDPHKHEAIGTEEVDDKSLVDTVITVMQKGYQMTISDSTEIIRPARVTTGIINE